MAALDRARPFGVISGDTEGRMYEQDGSYFTADGQQWKEPARTGETSAAAEPVAKPKPVAKSKQAPAPSEVDAQLSAQLGGAA